MKITVKSKKKSFIITLPTALIFNPIVFGITEGYIKFTSFSIGASKGSNKANGLDLSGIKAKDISKINKVMKSCKKADPDWVLVEVDAADGKHVTVKL